MAIPLKLIDSPELFFGFVSAVGADIDETMICFKKKLENFGYNVEEISITQSFEYIAKAIKPIAVLKKDTEYERIKSNIAYGNQLRSHYKDSGVLSAVAVKGIIEKRNPNSKPEKTAYLLRQFKRKEEIDTLRQIYGKLFFQVSIYSRRAARVEHLSRRFADDSGSGTAKSFRQQAEELVLTDENEITDDYGQRVGKIFHDADFIISADSLLPSVKTQVSRFCELLFASNSISPNKHEYGMFLAKAAALRTLDLSRQVGAAAFSQTGEVISLGSNEVPKATGGTYWSDEEFDDREYKRGIDSNDKRKKELLFEVFRSFDPKIKKEDLFTNKNVMDTQFMDALEYGRIIHAEMSVISDAARCGNSLRQAVLYTTTFPCHLCAKHIVSSGFSKVVFLEPYPKSLAEGLHADSIEFENSERGKYSKFPSVKFEHFFGVTPRKYRELFERASRKNDKSGKFKSHLTEGAPTPIVNIYYPSYLSFEDVVVKGYKDIVDKIPVGNGSKN